VLRGAVAAEPRTLVLRAVLADRLRRMGRTAEGEELLVPVTTDEDPAVASEAWLAIGKLRQAAGDRVRAAEAIQRGVEKARAADRLTPTLAFEYADSLVLAERFEDALEAADEILTVPAHQHLIRARVAQEQGDPALALKEYDKALPLWPDNPWTRYYAARAAEDVGDFDRALEEYRTSIRIDPGATEARTRAARILLAERKLRFASMMLREIDSKPLDAAGELLAVRLAARQGTSEDVDAALEGMEQGQAPLTAHAVSEIARGAAEGKAGPDGAMKLLRRAPGLDLTSPRDAEALCELVRFSHAADDGTPRELRAALAAHPDAAVFQAISGLDLELSGKADEARAAYARALELAPQEPLALLGLGRLTADSDPQKALALFDRAAAVDPGNPEPKLRAARALVAAGQKDPAAERLDALLRAHPLEAEAAALRASLDLERGVADERTVERARRAARFGGGPDALELLARVYSQLGDAEQAQKATQRAQALREKQAS
jgi:tetratricopeptide (TPR) repeat protein